LDSLTGLCLKIETVEIFAAAENRCASEFKAPAEPGLRQLVAASILAAVKACTPLNFTPSLGAAIAGQIFAIRFLSLPVTGKQHDI
jgi:hypothetical protein